MHPAHRLFEIADSPLPAPSLTIQERLGYDIATKLLIIHADDFGLCQSENAGHVASLEGGSVTSTSLMVPCPWFPEAADYAKAHPDADVGVHLTLTSEWKYYRWRPVLPAGEVPSLVDEQGFLYNSVELLGQHAAVEDVEKELRAQIARAAQFGVVPTHLDSHMFALLSKPDFLAVYLRLSREFNLPILLNREAVQQLAGYDIGPYLTEPDVVVDQLYSAGPENYAAGMAQFYARTLHSVPPGLSEIILHPAFDNAEMQAITVEHPHWGATWRQQDLDFFTSAECQTILKQEQIRCITWREVRDKLYNPSGYFTRTNFR